MKISDTSRKRMRVAGAILAFFFSGLFAQAQRARGELHVEARDPQGAALSATAELVSEANQFQRTFVLGRDGRYVIQDLAFGLYRLTLTKTGFSPASELVRVESEIPVHVTATLAIAPVSTKVEVSDAATLIDPNRTNSVYSIGRQRITEHIASQPGRDLADLVDDEPGWLYEANGVLHPRGSEYDVQYVVDGVPLTENRSPAFAPSFDANGVESARVLTAGYPAEYGRKLGGIIEVTTEKNIPSGLHGQITASGGSFDTAGGSAGLSYVAGKNAFALSANGFHTDRYLDPPVLPNFTNTGNANGFSASYERDLSEQDRVRVSIRRNAVRFLVPNELVQEQAGQRQDRSDTETSGQIDFQHVISPDLLFTASGSVRDISATLSSNAASTPVVVFQDRGVREAYVRGDLTGHHGRHDWKVGVDSLFGPVNENLQYAITDISQFDPGTQQQFNFSGKQWNVEPSGYIQDQIQFGNWNISAGLRFDHYALVVNESAWSPRIGIVRYIKSLNLLIHTSYDRVFQTPAVENLLLASSPLVDSLSSLVVRLPVRPARANYYEAGFTKSLAGKLRIDGNVFRRDFRNYSDDDVLLDTGVSFPIAFREATITGEELRLELPRWRGVSSYVSYTNQIGTGRGPITGGLFLGSDAANDLTNTSRFPVSQDQRNTLRARVRFEPIRKVWFAVSGQYGSGLPADIGDEDPDFLLAQFGPTILSRVNLPRGRVRPSASIDVGGGVEIYRKEQRSAEVQIQSTNITNRVNVINFASIFSGTAIAPPRSVGVRLRLSF